MSTRKAIRDQIKARLEPMLQGIDPDIGVYSFKKGKADGRASFVCLFFERGNAEHSTGERTDNAQLAIQIMMVDSTGVDDQLDTIGDAIENTIANDPFFDGVLGACSLEDWAYQRDTIPGWTGLRLIFATQYDA